MAWFQGDQLRILKIASKPLDFETGGITAMKMAHVRTKSETDKPVLFYVMWCTEET
jgi:hypothetical protein